MAVLRLRRMRKAPPLLTGSVSGGMSDPALIAAAASANESVEVAPALRLMRRTTIVIGLILVIAGALGGAGTVRLVLGPGGAGAPPVNVLVVLTSLLLVQMLALVVWIVLTLAPLPALRGAVIGRVHRTIVVRLLRGRPGRSGTRPDAARAVMGIAGLVLSRGAAARWTVAAAAHGFWSGFNIGAAVLLLMLLMTRQYAFVWETTILQEEIPGRMFVVMGEAPAFFGFPVPDENLVVASRSDRIPDDRTAQIGREAWAGFIVGSVLIYGFAPRILLLGLSLTLRRSALRRIWFDASDPDLIAAQMPLIDRDSRGDDPAGGGTPRRSSAQPPSGRAVRDVRRDMPDGRVAIFGYEIDVPATGWPPRLHEQRWHDMGVVETAAERRAVVDALNDGSAQIASVVMVVDLSAVPDRGGARFLRALAEERPGAVRCLLTGGERLRRRDGAEGVARRTGLWRACAEASGIDGESVLELDLDHMTDASRARLADFLAGERSMAAGDEAERCARAMTRLRAFAAEAQPGDPADVVPVSAASAAGLHADLLRLYGGTEPQGAVSRLLHDLIPGNAGMRSAEVAGALAKNPEAFLSAGAAGMLARLPKLVQREGRWVVAGAAGGALACMAAAMLAAPAAAAALPAWSLFGAAVTAAMRSLRASAGNQEEVPDHGDEARRLRTQVAAGCVHLLVLSGQSMPSSRAAAMTESVLLDLPLPENDRMREIERLLRTVEERLRAAHREHSDDPRKNPEATDA